MLSSQLTVIGEVICGAKNSISFPKGRSWTGIDRSLSVVNSKLMTGDLICLAVAPLVKGLSTKVDIWWKNKYQILYKLRAESFPLSFPSKKSIQHTFTLTNINSV